MLKVLFSVTYNVVGIRLKTTELITPSVKPIVIQITTAIIVSVLVIVCIGKK